MDNRFTRIAVLMALVSAVAVAPASSMGRGQDDANEAPDGGYGTSATETPNEVSGDTSDNAESGDVGGGGATTGSESDPSVGTIPPANDASVGGADATQPGDVDGADGGSPGTAGGAGGGGTGQ